MKRPYSSEFHPAAPVLPIVVRCPGGTDTRQLQGKIDSGADLCALPESVIAELDLPPVRVVRATGFAGVLSEVMLYHVEIEIAGRRLRHIETLGTRRTYALIGRNVLGHFVVTLDGPKSTLAFNEPRRRQR